MAIVTVRELQALTPAQNGQRVSMGYSMYGSVRIDREGIVSVYVVWRYKFSGKLRQMALGTWKEKNGRSLKALREERNALAAINPAFTKDGDHDGTDDDRSANEISLSRHFAEEQPRP